MYSEWTSLSLTLPHGTEDHQSVLEKFGSPVGKEITLGVVHQLASNLGITQPQEPSILVTDKDVSKAWSYFKYNCCSVATFWIEILNTQFCWHILNKLGTLGRK